MNKKDFKDLIDKGHSQREIGNILHQGQTTVRYWLNKYGLKTNTSEKSFVYKCGACGEKDPAKFYGHKHRICGKCHNQYSIKIWREKRNKILEIMGNKCVVCQFHRYKSSVDLHHVDATQKEKNFRRLKTLSWKNIVKEIEKCVLVCKNCHTAYHVGELIFDFTKIPRNYKLD